MHGSIIFKREDLFTYLFSQFRLESVIEKFLSINTKIPLTSTNKVLVILIFRNI